MSFMSVRWIPKCASPNRARAPSAVWPWSRQRPPAPLVKTEYVCPMHPEIVRAEPGACPICGMALEPRTVTLDEEANPELIDMTRRFWVGVILSLPIAFLAMSEMIPGTATAAKFFSATAQLGTVPTRHTGGALGRLAVFSARLDIHRQPQSQHVHAHRHRRRHGVRLQFGGDAFSRRISAIVPRSRR